MPLFRRFDKLPDKSEAIETEIRDLKQEMSPTKTFDLARDVAAFANHLGGAIIIGATEVEGRVGEYRGIPEALAAQLETALSQAVKDRCSPRPLYDLGRFPASTPGNVVLAVFVDPYIGGQPIGVAVKAREPGAKHDDPYVFPMRVGKDSIYLLPEQLPMFSDPRIRRITIQMSAIPGGAKMRVTKVHGSNPARGSFGFFRSFDLEKNVLLVSEHNSFGGKMEEAYPLDQVKTVYWNLDTWLVVVDVPVP